MSELPARKLGATGPSVFPLALGCMGMEAVIVLRHLSPARRRPLVIADNQLPSR